MTSIKRLLLAPAAVGLSAAVAIGCSSPPKPVVVVPAADVTVPSASPASTGLAFATMHAAGKTVQGATVDGFAYAEKTGDAVFSGVVMASGVARVTGVIWPQKGSTWAGIGLTVPAGAGGKPLDLSAYKTLHLRLASASSASLRVRVTGADKTTKDNGCYPVFVQSVTPGLAEHVIPLQKFAPEAYCGGNARSIASTASAVTAIEISDATVSGTAQRSVDFQVGSIELRP